MLKIKRLSNVNKTFDQRFDNVILLPGLLLGSVLSALILNWEVRDQFQARLLEYFQLCITLVTAIISSDAVFKFQRVITPLVSKSKFQ